MNKTEDSSTAPKQSGWKRLAIRVARTLAMSYVAIIILMVCFESWLLFPGAYKSGLNHDVTGPTAWSFDVERDGVEQRLTGHWIEHPHPEHTVIFYHGNGTNATRQIPWGERLSESWRANVLVAEYRGFVESDVTPSEANVIEDSLAIFDGLCESEALRPEDVIVYGRSLGGGCGSAVAAQRRIRALVLDRTFDSAAAVASGRFPFVPVKLLMRNPFDSVERLKDFRGPVVQIHGRSDRVVPFVNGQRLHRSLTTPNKLWIERDDFGHLDRMPEETLQQAIRWIEEQAE